MWIESASDIYTILFIKKTLLDMHLPYYFIFLISPLPYYFRIILF